MVLDVVFGFLAVDRTVFLVLVCVAVTIFPAKFRTQCAVGLSIRPSASPVKHYFPIMIIISH